MKHIFLFIIIVLSVFPISAQENMDIYLVEYSESNVQRESIQFLDHTLIRIPLENHHIQSIYISDPTTAFFKTYSKKDTLYAIWKFDIRKAQIKPILELKSPITAFIVHDNRYECIIRKKSHSYLISKKSTESKPSIKQLNNKLSIIYPWNKHKRVTIDKSHQLCLTDRSYERFKILNNHAYGPLYQLSDNSISFVYKFSEKYWYLKEYQFSEEKSRILVRLPREVGNYMRTAAGNFLCYNNRKLMSYNPNLDIDWNNVRLPFLPSRRKIAWMRCLSDSKMLVALDKD